MTENLQMHKVSELKSGQGNVNVVGVIKEKAELRTFNKYGRDLRVANAVFQDDSGNIKLTLWNDDAITFKEGDQIKIINGYVSEFQGEKQLTSGKFGKIEKTDGVEISKESSNEIAEDVSIGEEVEEDKPIEEEVY
jgi:replication factor A1